MFLYLCLQNAKKATTLEKSQQQLAAKLRGADEYRTESGSDLMLHSTLGDLAGLT
jgi:hypothetical protein